MAKDDWYADKESTDDQAGANRGVNVKGFQKDGKKKDDAKIDTTTVMFIPSTRGGLLTSMMRERETEMSSITRFKVKMHESGGIKLAGLFSTDLAKGQSCGRLDCQILSVSQSEFGQLLDIDPLILAKVWVVAISSRIPGRARKLIIQVNYILKLDAWPGSIIGTT